MPLGRQRRGLAGMDARQHHRRLAGIGRRHDPGVDAEIRRQHDAVPVECDRDAVPAFATGGKKRRDAGDQYQCAQRIGVAPRHPRRRPACLQRSRRRKRALDMSVPQRQRVWVLRGDGEIVGDRGRRSMAQPADRSSRLKPSRRPGMRRTRNGNIAAPATAPQAITAAARPSGGSHRNTPSQARVRNKPIAAASPVSAGHSRSQKITQRACLSGAAKGG